MGLMAMQYLNTPYKWAGNSYDGLDCSGFVLKVLHDTGLTLPDMTANDLYEYCKDHGKESSMACDSLLFFGSEKKVTHVAISMGEWEGEYLMIESGGAGRDSLNMTKEELAQRDARVRIKPIDSRKDLVSAILLK